MAPTLSPEDWRPVGVNDLEPNAWEALKHEGSALIVAGPGAGKTEFLAQRAAYLLQTGLCPAPYRILAISFKRDSAENLARRVQSRCTEGESRRLVSMTFDQFTKSLVDRFAAVLPAPWRLTRPYEVILPKKRAIDYFLDQVRIHAPSRWGDEVAGLGGMTFEPRAVGAWRLPAGTSAPNTGVEFALRRWWDERLGGAHPTLTFTCLNRLAELAVRTNPQLRRAILITYPFVFVDEFQDTTHAQYDFLSSVFAGNGAGITAVGDDKQRIMGWAGAREDVFSQFQHEFGACRIPLVLNHRSSPGLVRVQQVVARAIDPLAADMHPTTESEIDGDAAQVWSFPTPEGEASSVAERLNADMERRAKSPRDYALLVRQRADVFEQQIRPEFAKRGIRLRNESPVLGRTTLQDLLAEESTGIALAVLRLGAHKRAPEAWSLASQALIRLRAVDPYDDEASQRVQEELTALVRTAREEMREMPTSETAGAITDRVFKFLDPVAIRRAYTRYASGDGLEISIEAFRLHLQASAAAAANWIECLDLFEGTHATPLMTVHKSKGLEYDTIVFLGLDDESWWSHRPGDLEGRSTFFVALSRAKQRVIFTYCQGRSREKVADLYQLLTNAGVREVVH